tara:strand:- start:259 stop:693 length:435 start_codon:yes stop_codon:yes gene_type:complete
MKVICRYNKGSELPQYSKDWEYGFGPKTEFNLELNKEYLAYGMFLSDDGKVYYLLLGEAFQSPYYKPDWYPSVLFDVSDNKIPEWWYFKSFEKDKEFPLDAIWSYEEMTRDESHYIGLIEREIKDLQIFKERKKWIDREYPEEG